MTLRSFRKLTALAALVVGASVAFTGCSSGSTPGVVDEPGSDEAWIDLLNPIQLTVTDQSTPESPNGQAWLAFQEAVTERTEGKVTFENFWSSSLLSAGSDGVTGIGSGVADLGMIIPSYSASELPVASWAASLGALEYDSAAEAHLVGSAVSHFDYTESGPLIDELASKNLKALAAFGTVPYDLMCTSPVESVDDAQGLTARTSGPIFTEGLQALGMVPATFAFAEVYEALQRGALDCVTMPAYSYVDYGFVEVATDYVPVKLPQLAGLVIVINLDVWESFPVDLQRVFLEESVHVTHTLVSENLNKLAGFAEVWDEYGVTPHDATDLNQILSQKYATILKELPSTAPAGVPDAQAYVDQYMSRVDEWRMEIGAMGYESDPGATIRESYLSLKDIDLDPYYDALRESVQSNLP